MPLVKAKMGDNCKYYTVDKRPCRRRARPPRPRMSACGHIFCDSVESFQAGFGPHAGEILGDIKNYTDLTPVLQISEVVVG